MRISIQKLWKHKLISDENGNWRQLSILADISIDFCGDCVGVILGPSGSGKTTLLRLLNKLESPSSGKIFFNEVDFETISPRELRKQIGMVFQLPALFQGTVYDNISFGPELYKKTLDMNAVKSLLTTVGLKDIDPLRNVENLSLGQQQRLSFARALANEPRVLLLDEPTSALDPSAANNLLDLIKKINRETGVSILMVTHVLQHVQRIADNIWLLVDGKIVESGSSASFFKNPETEIGRKFIQGDL